MAEPHLLLWAGPSARLLPLYVFRGWVGERHLTEEETEAQRGRKVNLVGYLKVGYATSQDCIKIPTKL